MANNIRNCRGQYSKAVKLSKRGTPAVLRSIQHDHGHFLPSGDVADNVEVHSDSVKFNSLWREGRKVIELGVLLENLRFCKTCRLGPVPLTIDSVVGELKKGLSGYLYVQCSNSECGQINCVPYGKTYRRRNRGAPCFAANTKLGTAMIDSIGGANQVNNFISALNINPMSNSSLKKLERRAGEVVEKVALQSCANAAKEAFQNENNDVGNIESLEAAASMEGLIEDLGVAPLPESSPHIRDIIKPEVDDGWSDEDDYEQQVHSPSIKSKTKRLTGTDSNTPISKRRISYPCKGRSGMTCAVDTAWQKKGFDSLTSHTFFMSKAKYGKKVVKAVIGHRTCGTCKWWRRNRRGQPVRPHRCVHNHTGSAKLMESTCGERGIRELLAEGTPVDIIEGDGDNTLISRVKKNLNIDIKKKFDKNHIVKNIGKSLYTLHNKKGVKLSKSVIQHLQKCIKYVFAKNSGDLAGMQENLKALVPHQFGDHSLCSIRFCGHLRAPNDKYRHRGLPYKVPLQDSALRFELEQLFEPIIANAVQYCDLGSSQQCEHANREVILRAPKSHHYGNSESLDQRVLATAAFINEGRSYISEVNKEAGLSPGIFTEKYSEKCARQRKRNQERSNLISSKRRRLELKQERAINQSASEVLEGQTYESGIGHCDTVDIETIPNAIPKGTFIPVKSHLYPPTIITFDLETTDLIRGSDYPDITQLAAYNSATGHSMNTFIFPGKSISASAQQVTGFSVKGNKLYHFGKEVDTVPLNEALTKFIEWLEDFKNVILVAHNGRRFDFPIICSKVYSLNLKDRFDECVLGFVDSLPLCKKTFKEMSSYKQEDLVKNILNKSYGAHDALEDVKALSDLVLHAFKEPAEFLQFSFPPKSIFFSMMFNKMKATNILSLNVLVASGVCKRATAENIAGSGLNLHHLKLIYDREGEDGLRNTFIVKNSEGQPRVTSTKRVLDSVIPKLVEFLQHQ